MKILIVEDEDPKLEAVLKLLRQRDPPLQIEVARSVKSGLEKLECGLPTLLVLDMSLPTFDISADEPGGRPQGFGGIEIVRFLDAMDIDIPVVVVSGYEAFSKEGQNIDLRKLGADLMRDYPNILRGVVYFNSLDGHWQSELSAIVTSALKEKL